MTIMRLSKADRRRFPELFDKMFKSRAAVFHDRLRWNVEVRDGQEIDRYDEIEDPVYILSVDENGRLLGSLRLLATTGPTMLQSEFADFFDEDVNVCAPTIWECTRFCVPPNEDNSMQGLSLISAELLISLCELCLSSGIEFIVGVYDTAMVRIYQRIGWTPEPLARSRPEIGNISVGLWEATPFVLLAMKERLLARTSSQTFLAA